MTRISLITLGCKLNYAETSTYERGLENNGWEIVPWTERNVDFFLVNTCSVTEHSDKKSRNAIRKLHRICPSAGIVVTGCSAQLRRKDLESLQGVIRVFGATEKSQVVPYLLDKASGSGATPHSETDTVPTCCPEEYFRAYSTGERTRSFLKVQDGCDYKCHYCTVPYARGGSRSASISQIVEDARQIAARGIREIVITGVNTGDFGKNTGETFLDLLKALDKVEGIERFRISSIEPNLLTEETIDWIASASKVLPHFHIPLQSGCDTILQKMGRRYLTSDFAKKVEYIRKALEKPGQQKVFFGIDVIVGFPGESDEMFSQTYDFLEKVIKPSFIHIFPYSRRPGTPAASMSGQVQDSVKTFRVETLERLSESLHAQFRKENAGCRSKVLLEREMPGNKAEGWSENYLKVTLPYRDGIINTIQEVIL